MPLVSGVLLVVDASGGTSSGWRKRPKQAAKSAPITLDPNVGF
jgi:hypothetical protein